MNSWHNLSVLLGICHSLWYGCSFLLLKSMWALCRMLMSRQLVYSSWSSLCLCSLVVSMFVLLWTNQVSGRNSIRTWYFQLVAFFSAVCHSSGLMSSQGCHSASAYFCCSLLSHSAEWLCPLMFSNMLRQKISVGFFFGGTSTRICCLPMFLKNLFLLFANICFCLYYLLLFLHISWIFGLLLEFSFEAILLLFAVLDLLLFCISFLFFAFSWRSLGFHLSVPYLLVSTDQLSCL